MLPGVWQVAAAYARVWEAKQSLTPQECPKPYVNGPFSRLLMHSSSCKAHLLVEPPRRHQEAWQALGERVLLDQHILEDIVNDLLEKYGRVKGRVRLHADLGGSYYGRFTSKHVYTYQLQNTVRDAPVSLILTYQERGREGWERERGFLIISYTLPDEKSLRLEQVQGVKVRRKVERAWTPFLTHPISLYRQGADEIGLFLEKQLTIREYHVLPAVYRWPWLVEQTREEMARLYERYDLPALLSGMRRRVPDGILVTSLYKTTAQPISMPYEQAHSQPISAR